MLRVISSISDNFIFFQDNSRKTRDDSHHVQKQRPTSDSAQSITIRSYLNRFLKQSRQNVALNPLVTSAITAERPAQALPTKTLQSLSNQNTDKRNNFTFAMNYSSLHRPKLTYRNLSSGARPCNKYANDHELRLLTRGMEAENALLERHSKHDKQIAGGKPLDNGILESQFGVSGFFIPPQGSFLPPQACSNINRLTKLDQQIGLSIVSTPAPLQYKDESFANPSAESVSTNSLASNGAYRLVYV